MDAWKYREILSRAPVASDRYESVGDRDGDLPEPTEMRRAVEDHVDYLEHLLDTSADADARDALLDAVTEGGLRIQDRDVERLTPREEFGLEAVVRSDGSRPALFVQDDFVDVSRPEAGPYAARLAAAHDRVRDVCRAVGRVDDPSASSGFQGTAWMINDSMAVTNFHVLQAICVDPVRNESRFSGTLHPNVFVDFGHEVGADPRTRRFPVTSIVAVGPAGRPEYTDPAAPGINFDALDLAIIELGQVPGQRLPKPVRVARGDDPVTFGLRADKGRSVYVVGFPAGPGSLGGDVFEALFHGISGFKRLAPGSITRGRGDNGSDPRKWVIAHDASTLGGNSGSAVMDLDGDARTALGLHFGGWQGHENWAHALEAATEVMKPWLP